MFLNQNEDYSENPDSYIIVLNETIEQCKKIEQEGKEAMELAEHPVFKKLVLEGYFKEEAARLAEMISSPVIDEKTREDINRNLMGIGGFKRYLSMKVQMGQRAAQDRKSAEQALVEMYEESSE